MQQNESSEGRDPITSITVKMKIEEFTLPPVLDALVLGKDSPIGCEAIRRALTLIHPHNFEHIEIEDEIAGDVLIRESVLRKVPRDKLVALILKRAKPMMDSWECLHLTISTEVTTEDQI